MTNDHDSNGSSNLVFFSVVGVIFVLAIVGVLLWMQNFSFRVTTGGGFSFNSNRKVRVTPTPDLGGEEAETAHPDLDAVIAAIDKGGCVACHTIPNIPNAVGQVGPNLSNIGVDAATRRDGYSAEEYIRESLMEPSAFTASECPLGPCVAGTMPQLNLEQSEIETLVSYLSTLGVE